MDGWVVFEEYDQEDEVRTLYLTNRLSLAIIRTTGSSALTWESSMLLFEHSSLWRAVIALFVSYSPYRHGLLCSALQSSSLCLHSR